MAVDLREAIGQIETAEDLFALLDVPFDPSVLAVHRLHILKRFGMEVGVLERRDPPLAETERLHLYAAALQRTHDLHARGDGAIEPFFRPRPRGLVTLDPSKRGINRIRVA
jgi:nitrogenase-stabilizing/protective protein